MSDETVNTNRSVEEELGQLRQQKSQTSPQELAQFVCNSLIEASLTDTPIESVSEVENNVFAGGDGKGVALEVRDQSGQLFRIRVDRVVT